MEEDVSGEERGVEEAGRVGLSMQINFIISTERGNITSHPARRVISAVEVSGETV